MTSDGQDNIDLTHEEIWDDSALVSSWNDAYEEYQKYHSLATKGEQASPRPTRAEALEAKSRAAAAAANGGSSIPQPGAAFTPLNFAGPSVPTPLKTSNAPNKTTTLPAMPSMPQTLLGATQDETIKNLMMSWYYAGYYTGLLEGKQQAFASLQEEGE